MRTFVVLGTICVLLLSSFNKNRRSKLRLPEEFVMIPAGTMKLDPNECSNHNHSGDRISFYSFYMSKYEVTNLQYRQFYIEVAAGLSEVEKQVIACDSLGWRQFLAYCEPMKEYYFNHPAYNNYPVLNISHAGALRYCQWLEEKIQKENPEYRIRVDLPKQHQWTYAAGAGRSQAIYPWGNYYLRNKKGEFLCNFRYIGDHMITRNRETGKAQVTGPSFSRVAGGIDDNSAIITANVKSYYPNDYGLYNMCGNAAEMIDEKGKAMGGSWDDYGGDISTRAISNYEQSAPTVGFRPIISFEKIK